jgi:signal transduction histidine kinase
VNHDAGSPPDVPEMLRRTTRDIVRALNAHAGAAWRLSHTGDQLIPVAGYHIPKQALPPTVSATIPVSRGDPLLRDAVQLRRPIYSADSATDARFQYPWARLLPHKSILILPLALPSTGRLIGGLAIVWTEEGHEFSPHEIRLAEAIAQQAANAVENAQVLAEFRSQAGRLQEVLQANLELFRGHSTLASLAKTIAEVAMRLFPGDRVEVRVSPAENRPVKGVAGLGEPVGSTAVADQGAEQWANLVEAISATVIGTGEPMLTGASTADGEPTHLEAALQGFGYRGLLAVPLTVRSIVHGALTIVTSRSEGFAAEDLSILTVFALQATLAIDEQRRREAVDRQPTELPTTWEGRVRAVGAPIQDDRLGPARQLARGVAHTFNNPLSVIVGRVQLALRLRPNDAELRHQLEAVEQAALKSAEIVRRLQLLTRARRTTSHVRVLPDQLLEEVRESVKIQLKQFPAGHYSIVIETRDVPSLPAIAGDPAELREALMNLVSNALEAMSTGGIIRLTAVAERDAVRMIVEDTGSGMASDVEARIFEPFFTTKGPAHAGLGLSVVSAIVQRHSGSVGVETAEGKGTAFTLRLPVWRDSLLDGARTHPSH